MISRITLFLVFYLTASASIALTTQDELILTAGMDCYENKDLVCAIEQFEMALEAEDSGMNSAQRNSIKKLLFGIYFKLAHEMAAQQSFDGMQELCNRGIALGVDLGMGDSVASRSFHIWYTIALLQKKGIKETRDIADRLQQVHQELTADPYGEHLSYLYGGGSALKARQETRLD